MIGIVAAVLLAGGPIVSPPPATVEYVRSLRPSLPASEAKRLTGLINYWSKRMNVSGRLVAAILKQESNFQSGLKQCWTVRLRRGRIRNTCDLGIAQVNDTWVKRWKLDPELLQNDDGYNIATAARILAWIKKYFPGEHWYGRYHSGTPSLKRAYAEKVGLYLAME